MGKTPDRFRKTNTLQLLSTPVSMLYLLHQTRQISHIQQRVRRGGMFFKKKEKKKMMKFQLQIMWGKRENIVHKKNDG